MINDRKTFKWLKMTRSTNEGGSWTDPKRLTWWAKLALGGQKAPHLVGKAPHLVGKAPHLVGKAPHLVGKNGRAPKPPQKKAKTYLRSFITFERLTSERF